ncbi:MAG: hypothetical protein WC455_29845 [Dehalococcoidia bacterium]
MDYMKEWHAGHIGDGEYRHEVVFDSACGQVATVTMPGDVKAARLIAAAPEMLDAIQWLKQCTDAYYGAKTREEMDWVKPDLDHAFHRCWEAIEFTEVQ